MKNVVYMKMLYYPCNNKSLADAAGRKIVINDFGEKKCLWEMFDSEGGHGSCSAPAWLAGTALGVEGRCENKKSTVCRRNGSGLCKLIGTLLPGWGGLGFTCALLAENMHPD